MRLDDAVGRPGHLAGPQQAVASVHERYGDVAVTAWAATTLSCSAAPAGPLGDAPARDLAARMDEAGRCPERIRTTGNGRSRALPTRHDVTRSKLSSSTDLRQR
jgi:hypothetical protein